MQFVPLEVCHTPKSACFCSRSRERKGGKTHNPIPMEVWGLRRPILVVLNSGA